MRVLLLCFLIGCGGGAPRQAAPVYQPEAPTESAAAGAPSSVILAAEDAAPGGSSVSKRKVSVFKPSPISQPEPKPQDPKSEPDTKGMAKPIVVYFGYLQLRVRRIIEAVDAITQQVEEAGGYIESLTQKVIVVRVPAGDFEGAMKRLARVGKVLSRKVKALDVTARFTDLQGRLVVAKEARERLLELLEEVTDTTERLRILQEIKRLTEQIESIESTLGTLQNLVDFYTITIELVPVSQSRSATVHRSPFPWARRLRAHQQSIREGKDDISLKLPKGFVLFDEDDAWRARAADTTIIRAGYVENEPRGDSAWWSDAVKHEMLGRDEEVVAEGTGALAWRLYRNKEPKPRTWLIGLLAKGERLYVVEVFFPNPEAFERHNKAVIGALESLRVKK